MNVNLSGMEMSLETRKDVAVVVSFVFSAILFLGNFGLMGRMGAALSDIQFGLFGRFASILPILVFIGAVYLIANIPEKTEKAVIRVFIALIALSALCGLAQLFNGELTGPSSLGDYYLQGKDAAIGGAMGGLMLYILLPALGTLGTAIVLITMLIVCVIALTGMSVLSPIRQKSIDAAASARLRNEKKREKKAYDRLRRSAELIDEYERAYDNRQMLEQEVSDYEGYIQDMEKNAWDASEEQIVWYRANAESLRLQSVQWMYSESGGEAYQLVWQYMEGEVDLDTMLSGLDKKLQMMMMEGN
jgi:hypothetical protein